MDKKKLSKQHEDHISELYGGIRSPSSGAADTDAGDVRAKADGTLFECKMTGSPGQVKRSTIVKQMEKIWDEANEEGREPALALRYFDPASPLADHDGWIDLIVRLADDDAERSRDLRYWHIQFALNKETNWDGN